MMRLWLACLSLCLVLLSVSAFADEDELTAPDMHEEAPATVFERETISGDGCPCQNWSFCPGWFAGLGGSYNSVKVDQNFGGTATTNVFESGVLTATGSAGGLRRPFTKRSPPLLRWLNWATSKTLATVSGRGVPSFRTNTWA